MLPALALWLGNRAAQGRGGAWVGLLPPPAARGRCSGHSRLLYPPRLGGRRLPSAQSAGGPSTPRISVAASTPPAHSEAFGGNGCEILEAYGPRSEWRPGRRAEGRPLRSRIGTGGSPSECCSFIIGAFSVIRGEGGRVWESSLLERHCHGPSVSLAHQGQPLEVASSVKSAVLTHSLSLDPYQQLLPQRDTVRRACTGCYG
ncbi:hypothetical protein J1605_012981 [Eschrichtius robustus]|uniref:Uncharacterized protein n=1 Tax=Eschrichtius robustus TaxID=9764 RepID=A0AB34GKY6_ESCRO|nr:hypothetical protein J1605_012981 [Eschrichtius robustus]